MPIRDPEKLKAARQRCNEKRKGKRTRGWACIAWADSAPEGWLDRLGASHVQMLVSPLHDKDLAFSDDGGQELKKPHWHVLAMFDQPASEKQAQELFNSAGICFKRDGTPAPPEMVKSVKGYSRYLVHMDDHDKYRYEEREVMELCGATWRAVALDPSEEIELMLGEIEDFVFREGYDSYSLLLRYAREHRPDWSPVLRKRTIHVKGFVQSYAHDVTCGLVAPPIDSPAWQRQKLAREREASKR